MSKLLLLNAVKISFILFGVIPVISIILFGSMPMLPTLQSIVEWIGTELMLGVVLFLVYLLMITLRILSKKTALIAH